MNKTTRDKINFKTKCRYEEKERLRASIARMRVTHIRTISSSKPVRRQKREIFLTEILKNVYQRMEL